MNRQGAKRAKENQVKKANGKRKGAEAAKETQRKTETEFLCGFSLRLRAFAVIAFLCVSFASLRLCDCGFSSFHGVPGVLAV